MLGDAKKSTAAFLEAASKHGQGCSFPFALLQCWRPTANSPGSTCQTKREHTGASPPDHLCLAAFWVPRAMVHTEELLSLKAGVSHQIQRQGEIQQAGKGEGLTE